MRGVRSLAAELNLEQMRRGRTTEHVIEQLASAISSGKVSGGERLPSEMKLMEQLGVGRSSIREAIGALTLTGLLVVRPGKGTYVNGYADDFLTKPLSWGIPLGRARIQELIEARSIIEEGIASLAAQRASEADMEESRLCLRKEKNSRANLRQLTNAGMSFHYSLAKATHNSLLINIYKQIGNLMRSWTEQVYMVPGIPESAVIDHGEILDAIASHDDEKARAAIRKHMESSRCALGATNLIRPRTKSRMSRITGEK